MVYGRGLPYQFVALLFDLSTTSRVFTKVLSLVLCFLDSLDTPVIGYLGDLLLREHSTLLLLTNVSDTVHTLERLRWFLNLP